MSYIEKSSNDMLASFPAPVQGITGEPSLRELIRLIKHLMECSQKVETDISPLNYLFLVLESELYATHTAEMYPSVPNHPGRTPAYTATSTPGERANVKQEWEYALMRHNNCLNMNAALKSRFLSLIDANIVDTYKSAAGILAPNCAYIELLAWFTSRYATSNEADRSQNKVQMETPWNPGDGFEALITKINEGMIFADIAGYPIEASEVVDVAIRVAMRSGIFAMTYKAWHQRQNNAKTWVDFQNFWGEQFRLERDVARAAGSFGFGGNATGNEGAEPSIDDSINKFAAAHSATQSTINGLTASNHQLAAANHHLQQQLANASMQQQQMQYQRQQQPYQAPNPPAQMQQQNSGRRGKGKNGNNAGWNPTGNNGGNQQPQQQQRQGTNYTVLATGQAISSKLVKSWNADNDNYCWTHGGICSVNHNSKTCTTRHQSGMHQEGATRQNMMGGNPAGLEKMKPSLTNKPRAQPQQANVAWNPHQQPQQQVQQQQQQMWNQQATMPFQQQTAMMAMPTYAMPQQQQQQQQYQQQMVMQPGQQQQQQQAFNAMQGQYGNGQQFGNQRMM